MGERLGMGERIDMQAGLLGHEEADLRSLRTQVAALTQALADSRSEIAGSNAALKEFYRQIRIMASDSLMMGGQIQSLGSAIAQTNDTLARIERTLQAMRLDNLRETPYSPDGG